MKKREQKTNLKKWVRGLLKTMKAFSLLEMLIVVLMVSLLASIGIPKYKRAIQVARAAEIAPNLQALEMSINVYIEEKGFTAGHFLGSGKTKRLDADLGLPDCSETQKIRIIYNIVTRPVQAGFFRALSVC